MSKDVLEKTLSELQKNSINLADASQQAKAIFATDDFFAAKERMLNPHAPEWREGEYDDHGKWMDGWESRRKRGNGYDYCIVRLSQTGMINAIDVDTRYFTGNYPPITSVDACLCDSQPKQTTQWTTIIDPSPLQGDRHNLFVINQAQLWSHIRVNIFPDGGIARLRVYGKAVKINSNNSKHLNRQNSMAEAVRLDDAQKLIELSAQDNGGVTLECSDAHFGDMHNLLKADRGVDMSDGWETRRRREPGYDWVILKLGQAGLVEKIEIDTAHFKGNFPHQVSINAAYLPQDCDENMAPRSLYWEELLSPQYLNMHAQHFFSKQINKLGPVTHARVNIHPDGGLSRVRLWGNAVA